MRATRPLLLLVTALAVVTACAGGGGPSVAAPSRTPEPTAASPHAAASPAAGASPDAGASPGASSPARGFAAPQQVGRFDAEVVPEASGLAASRRNPGVLYLVDDAAGTSAVYAVERDGTAIGHVGIAGLDARDTEALAVAPCAPGGVGTCLYVGDIGDNLATRDTIALWRVEEPALAAGPPAAPPAADQAVLRYPDGAHDAEALLVDDDGRPFVVTKTAAGAPHLYGADGFTDQTLVDHGAIDLPEPALPLASSLIGNLVTGGDVRDGHVLLRTYDTVFGYEQPGAPLETLPEWPATELPAPLEPQGEAVAWAADGCGFYTVSEGVGDIWYVGCAGDPEG